VLVAKPGAGDAPAGLKACATASTANCFG